MTKDAGRWQDDFLKKLRALAPPGDPSRWDRATLAELRMHDGIRVSCPYGVTRVASRQGERAVLRWVAALR